MLIARMRNNGCSARRCLVFLGVLAGAFVLVTYPHWWIMQPGVSATLNGKPIRATAHRRGAGLYLFHLTYAWHAGGEMPVRETYLVDSRSRHLYGVDSPRQIVDAHFVAFSLDLPYPHVEHIEKFSPKIEWDPQVVFADSSVSFEDWNGDRFCLHWR